MKTLLFIHFRNILTYHKMVASLVRNFRFGQFLRCFSTRSMFFYYNMSQTIPTQNVGLVNYNFNRGLLVFPRLYTRSKTCWQCKVEVDDNEFVCSKCDCLQTPDLKMNYFQLMKIEESFDLDVVDLMVKFKDLQRKFHPDKYGQKSKTEQDYSAIYSAQINKAYQTLLKPFQRGVYLLELKGRPLKEEAVTMDATFLSEIMAINEAIDEKSTNIKEIKKIAAKNCAKIDDRMAKLSKELKAENWNAAQALLAEMKYYSKIDDRIKLILNEEQIKNL